MTAPQRPAHKSVTAWLLFAGLVVGGLSADLWTKHAVFEHVRQADPESPHPSVVVIDGALSFRLQTNSGVVFGIQPPRWLILVASVVALAAIGFFFVTTDARDHVTHVALGLILGGALGNLYDRLFARVQLPRAPEAVGEVRDFIDMTDLGYPWVFNIADVLLVIGVVLIAAIWIFGSHGKDKSADDASADQER